MTVTATKISALAWCRQPDYNGGLEYSSPRSFTTSGAGDAGGTTVVSTNLGSYSDGNDDFVGWVLECVSGTAANLGLRRRIKSYVDSTGTATIDALPSQVASGDIFAIYKPPTALAVAAAAGSNTNGALTTRDRNEANSYWKGHAAAGGYYVEGVAGATTNIATNILVSTNYASNSQLVVASDFPAARAIGHYFEVWKYPEILSPPAPDTTIDPIERNPTVGVFGRRGNRHGNRGGSIAVELLDRGPGASTVGSEAHEALAAVLDATGAGGTDTTVNGSPGTTSVPTAADTFNVGEMLLLSNGNTAMITADSGSAYTVTPALPAAPQVGEAVYHGITYAPPLSTSTADWLNYALTIKRWIGADIAEYLFGAVPNVSFSATRGDFAKWNFAFTFADWIRVGQTGTVVPRTAHPKVSTVDPQKCGAGRCVLGGTAYSIRSFSIDLGLDIQPRGNLTAPNETSGLVVMGDNPTGTIELYYDSTERAAIDKFLSGAETDLLVQFGHANHAPGVTTFWAYKIAYTGAALGDDAGQITISMPFQVVRDPSMAATLPRYAFAKF